MSKLCTILLVEDDAADAHLTRMAFEEGRIGVDLQHVENGEEALAYLKQESTYQGQPKPDLILLDLNMPRMDGREFLKQIKQNKDFRAIPIVVLTTSDAETDVYASYDQGAAGFIVKPVSIDDFVHQIQKLENYWFELVKRPAYP
ncbi:Response regulator receiver domain-containing protein [Marinospirillum celere]|uniref:Response regulator receiver domain-containing protein n=1 Tax=Marinospirillum celere TaxID=1122252 RepID=A0A1I1J8A2_9GAMM|nr:response regulator [Marinospirillum celere]SFC44212.1 Response regulator receiver domain-containing protein [Marinospirillum celere]